VAAVTFRQCRFATDGYRKVVGRESTAEIRANGYHDIVTILRTVMPPSAWFGTVIFGLLCMEFSAKAMAEETWQNLKRMRRDREYTVVLRNGSCLTGRVEEVDDSVLKLSAAGDQQARNTGSQTIKGARADILRVTDNRSGDPHGAIYSGRSSWADVRASRPYEKSEWLKIVDKKGKEQTCKSPQVVEDGLKCGNVEISKKEIARVYYVRLKPASDWLEYASREGVGWLDARTWFNYALLGRIDVLLFDSALPEDNQPKACRVGGQ
jgi:hypothetical protein